MKSTLKICNMKTLRDVSIVRNSIARNEGVVACQLNREKGEVEIVYDNYLLDINIVIEDLEELGFNVV
ncbi:Copper chaperone CopZ [Clostridium acidisoli DSM 12555]|uniref:Copper chaperone CopZ n=1 Tax=Clostridium acidisoli DSM 12555 TaxID=1121291 RepID=A0A1W1XTT2_9CLOT|nr:heavy-metal-associated domain-containing protein [Clostridium acidisoli]SMC27274.1 Copper chaperone CopZ [Clostridium acidisoli DSM 12555]